MNGQFKHIHTHLKEKQGVHIPVFDSMKLKNVIKELTTQSNHQKGYRLCEGRTINTRVGNRQLIN